ncbi:MAG: hypothetical protein MASP_01831 [Candidatus Methanolliviera sp. GoM_asphalt]|nr:MAG: hypothetical protein MASP_01831 [Candidatus Methanolliviera sp. GoM_asphalt]
MTTKVFNKGRIEKIRKLVLASLVLLLLLVPISTVAARSLWTTYGGNDKVSVIQEKPEDFLTYENKTLGFKMKYPSNWKIIDMSSLMPKKMNFSNLEEYQGLILALDLSPTPKGLKSPRIKENVITCSVNVYDFTKNVELEKLINYRLDVLSKSPHCELEEVSDASLGGMPAQRIVYTRNIHGIKYKMMELYTVKGDKGYGVLFVGVFNSYDKYIDTVNQIIDSFEFI